MIFSKEFSLLLVLAIESVLALKDPGTPGVRLQKFNFNVPVPVQDARNPFARQSPPSATKGPSCDISRNTEKQGGGQGNSKK